MAPGFVITKINDEQVEDVEDFQEKFENSSGIIAIEGVYEGYGGAYFYEFNKEG